MEAVREVESEVDWEVALVVEAVEVEEVGEMGEAKEVEVGLHKR